MTRRCNWKSTEFFSVSAVWTMRKQSSPHRAWHIASCSNSTETNLLTPLFQKIRDAGGPPALLPTPPETGVKFEEFDKTFVISLPNGHLDSSELIAGGVLWTFVVGLATSAAAIAINSPKGIRNEWFGIFAVTSLGIAMLLLGYMGYRRARETITISSESFQVEHWTFGIRTVNRIPLLELLWLETAPSTAIIPNIRAEGSQRTIRFAGGLSEPEQAWLVNVLFGLVANASNGMTATTAGQIHRKDQQRGLDVKGRSDANAIAEFTYRESSADLAFGIVFLGALACGSLFFALTGFQPADAKIKLPPALISAGGWVGMSIFGVWMIREVMKLGYYHTHDDRLVFRDSTISIPQRGKPQPLEIAYQQIERISIKSVNGVPAAILISVDGINHSIASCCLSTLKDFDFVQKLITDRVRLARMSVQDG